MKTYEWIDLGDGREIYTKKEEFRFIPNKFGEAPMVMFDSMEPEYHHGVCRTINSRKEWQQADKESGSATISPHEWKAKREKIPATKRAIERELAKDRRQASVKALKAFRENPQRVEEKLKIRAEEQEQSARANDLIPLITENVK